MNQKGKRLIGGERDGYRTFTLELLSSCTHGNLIFEAVPPHCSAAKGECAPVAFARY